MNRPPNASHPSNASFFASSSNLIQVDPTFFEVCQFEHALKKVYSAHGEKIDDRLIPNLHLLTQQNKQKRRNIAALKENTCVNETNRNDIREIECTILIPSKPNSRKKYGSTRSNQVTSIPSRIQEQMYMAVLYKRNKHFQRNYSNNNLPLSGFSGNSAKCSKTDSLFNLEAQLRRSKPASLIQLNDNLTEVITEEELEFETSSAAVFALSAHFSTANIPQNTTSRNLKIPDDQAVMDDYLDMLEDWEKWHGKYVTR